MSIERLNKAASAAGFAMATPDDDTPIEPVVDREARTPALTVAVAPSSPRLVSPEAVTSLTNWVKGHLPGFGGRQPA